MVLHSGRGRRGDINTLEVGASGGESGDREGGREGGGEVGRGGGVMPCGDDTICLVVSLSWRSDPDNDTSA